MKTKLTLTVDRSIIIRAKRRAEKEGKSLSSMFEEIFSDTNSGYQLPPTQKETAFQQLSSLLKKSKPFRKISDKELDKQRLNYLMKKHG
jgi:hypothetical protein